MSHTITHTYVKVPVSLGTFAEVVRILAESGSECAITRGPKKEPLLIDMHGMALSLKRESTPADFMVYESPTHLFSAVRACTDSGRLWLAAVYPRGIHHYHDGEDGIELMLHSRGILRISGEIQRAGLTIKFPMD